VALLNPLAIDRRILNARSVALSALVLILHLCSANSAFPQTSSTELVVQTGITENPLVAFSPDGTWFATGDKGRLVISDLHGHQLRTIQNTDAGGPGGGYISISANGTYAAVYDELSRQTSIWNVVSGESADAIDQWITQAPWKVPALFRSAAFSPHGNSLAVANMNGEIFVLDTADGHVIGTFAEYDTPNSEPGVTPTLVFSPDGDLLAASWGNHVRVWRWRSDKVLGDISAESVHTPNLDRKVNLVGFPGGGDPNQTARTAGLHLVAALAWSRDSSLLMLVHQDEANVLDVPSLKKKISVPAADGGLLWSGIFTPDNRIILGSAGPTVMADLTTWQTRVFPNSAANYKLKVDSTGGCDPSPCGFAPGTSARSFAFSPDGKLLLIGDNTGLRVLHYPDEAQENLITSVLSSIRQIQPLGARPVLAFGSAWPASEPLIFWDLVSGRPSPAFPDRKEDFQEHYSISGTGNRIAFVDGVSGILVWDINDNRQVQRFPYSDLPSSIALNPDGTMLALTSSNSLLLCEVVKKACALVELPLKDARPFARFTGKGSFLFVTLAMPNGIDRKFLLFDGHSGSFVRDISADTNRRQDYPIKWVQISDDEAVMAVSYENVKTVPSALGIERVDFSTGESLNYIYEKNAPGAVDARLSPSGRWIATTQLEFKMWDFATGAELFHVRTPSPVADIVFDPREKWVAVNTNRLGLLQSGGTPGGVIQFHSFQKGELLGTILLFASTRKDWLVTSPAGFFDGTPAAWDRGLWRFEDNTFRFAPIEIFFRNYYLPGLLPKILSGTLPEAPSVANINRVQPTVRIGGLSHDLGSRTVSIGVDVSNVVSQTQKDKNGAFLDSGVYDVRLFRDNQMVAEWPEPVPGSIEKSGPIVSDQDLQLWRRQHQVNLNSKGNATITFRNIRLPRRSGLDHVEFTAYAFNSDRVKSLITPPHPFSLPPSSQPVSRTAFLLSMGVNANQSRNLDLDFAVSSAEKARSLLRSKLQADYQQIVEITLYSDRDSDSDRIKSKTASKADLQAVLDLLAGRPVPLALRDEVDPRHQLRPATPDDAVVLFVASHGYADPQGIFYLMPYDTGSQNWGVTEDILTRCLTSPDPSDSCKQARDLLQHSVSSGDLTAWWNGVDAGQMIMILDTCHSGAIPGKEFRPAPLGDPGFGQLSYDKGMIILTASQPTQTERGESVSGGEGRTLLVDALDTVAQANPMHSLERWLQDTERQLPKLAKSLYPQLADENVQHPSLLNFSTETTSNANPTP
jgi:WD40 repeat protein